MELDKQYNSKEVETKWYRLWEEKGYFRPASDFVTQTTDHRQQTTAKTKKKPAVCSLQSAVRPYVIVIPPPNVTGILHMGHALNSSIQDILIRWNRMKGHDTLWVPGVDHAGIATQNVVEKKLAKEKKTRWDLGREKFLEEVWKWKNENGSTITRQLRRLGASCDWTRERVTMDEGLSKAVREAFVTLYERGLIYRGNYIINWCPRCQTALSDEEAAHKDVQGGLYHIKYLIVGERCQAPFSEIKVPGTFNQLGIDHIVVATTRPETMLGDTAVAVHPDDPRYKHLVGKKVILPLLNREIPVIADEFVDPEFGTGIVKVTPAHDPNDFAMGHRHKLEQINVMTPDGKINEHGGAYKGMDRFEARKKILQDLEEQGLFVRRDSHLHAVGHCYRCDTMVEPYLSKQWFVKMKPLAEKALKAHREGKTKFYPDRWTKVYTNWLEGIRDWCISRQIWWGHQVPVWYCKKCSTEYGERRTAAEDQDAVHCTPYAGIIVSRIDITQCPHCGSKDIKRDPDVLDTWFSSWLWPFSTLGWPEKTEDLKKFYPTSDLVTAPEIIFFWVARMIMAGLEFIGEVPFTRINIHGTVRAQTGLKMSKSLGNAIDPLEVIEEMGADALRYSLVMLSAQDLYLCREKFEVGRNFANKVWNACRFVMMQLEGFNEASTDPAQFKEIELSLPSCWILSRLEEKTATIEKHLSQFGLAQAATELYHFVWDDFCDWYIELAKPMVLSQDPALKLQTQKVLFFVCERMLRLLHPFMPFITEEIWQKIRGQAPFSQKKVPDPLSIMLAAWPYEEKKKFHDAEAQKAISLLQDAVGGIRDLRVRFKIAPTDKLKAVISCKEQKTREILQQFEREVKVLARLETLDCVKEFKKQGAMVANSFADFDVFISLEGILDLEEEKKRLQKKIQETEQWIEQIRKKVENPSFVKKAPKEILEKEKEKLNDAKSLLVSHKTQLAGL